MATRRLTIIGDCPIEYEDGQILCWCCDNKTIYTTLDFIGYADYRGEHIMLISMFKDVFTCWHIRIGPMHHHGDKKGSDGKLIHYCPTGFLYCPDCCGTGEEPDPFECWRWGE